jgi:hypothetical protein
MVPSVSWGGNGEEKNLLPPTGFESWTVQIVTILYKDNSVSRNRCNLCVFCCYM